MSDRAREHVRREAARNAGESTSVVRLRVRRSEYRVPGRKRSGAPRGGRVRSVVLGVVLAPLAVLALPVVVVLGALDDLGIRFRRHHPGELRVRGASSSCAAAEFADAVRGADLDLWLAWSRSQVALLGTSDGCGVRVLWRGTGERRPKVRVVGTTLRWPDGSHVEFVLAEGERNRVVDSSGTP